MHAVVVEFFVAPGSAERFAALLKENAETSLRVEPGCRRFDVWTDASAPTRFFLYELYDDAAAFEAHLTAPHFQDFAAATAEMVAHKTVSRFSTAVTAAELAG